MHVPGLSSFRGPLEPHTVRAVDGCLRLQHNIHQLRVGRRDTGRVSGLVTSSKYSTTCSVHT